MDKEEKKLQDIDKELDKSQKSNETAAKSHGEILKEQICEGNEVYKRSTSSILLSSLTAGLEIGFSYLMICSVFFYFEGKVAEDTLFKLMALVYPLGFIMVVLGQSILFTEQTSLLTLPVLNKKHSVGSLLRLWGLVILGNLLGGWLIALVLRWIGPELGIFTEQTITKIAEHVTHFSPLVIVVSAVLAGWLMGLLSWLITSSKDTVSRIVIIYMITALMAFTGLHHSIIGNIEVFAGMLSSPTIMLTDYLTFQSLALTGNAMGGAIFVALLKYRAFVFNV
ncbi:formate/nitrite transporter family protein [Galbibacter mesophilus]|uniref:formate/nitrite transporter family protein n=1 Tax=Galbibacter mesophilus TaxID=379069 RepID=UPI00191FD945|nr:formate/nitrite transporter family protein [Galbibacter mesophilus]MCM5663318.1 formate/nitrite transporter family protein [Galbibacter mesophilus]